MAIVMTSAEFVQKLKNIVNRANYYYNVYPYNMGYYNGYAISFDCWNLVKSLLAEYGTVTVSNIRISQHA